MSVYLIKSMADIRMNERMKEAERHRLRQLARGVTPRLGDRLLLRVADSLVAAGLRLRARHQPIARLQPRVYH
jgi:hypothetical protein